MGVTSGVYGWMPGAGCASDQKVRNSSGGLPDWPALAGAVKRRSPAASASLGAITLRHPYPEPVTRRRPCGVERRWSAPARQHALQGVVAAYKVMEQAGGCMQADQPVARDPGPFVPFFYGAGEIGVFFD